MSTRQALRVHLTKANWGRLRAECGTGKWEDPKRLRLSGDLSQVTCRKCLQTNAALNYAVGR